MRPLEIHADRTGLLVVRSLHGAFRRGPHPCVDQSMQPRVSPPLCITLEDLGGKGASLARLANAGLPVPGGIHVTTEAYRRFVAANDLQPAVLEAAQAVSLSEPSTLEAASRTIADLFARAPMPTEIVEDIARAYAALPGAAPAVAVRSSSTAEDLPELSFRRTAGDVSQRAWRRAWFHRLLQWAQRYAPLREDALGDTGLGWPLLRRMLLELGRRLASAGAIERADDVFWLTEAELDQMARELDAGQTQLADATGAVDKRKTRVDREGRHTPPPSLPDKATFAGLDFSRWLPASAAEQSGTTIKGLGASPGRVTATARVLHGPEDFGQMQPGDVLVAAITTPAWTPLFALAAAVVTDVGGPLSHSSIVAREYGVPAVLGTGVATRRIHSGDVITVDGSAGVVTLPAERRFSGGPEESLRRFARA